MMEESIRYKIGMAVVFSLLYVGTYRLFQSMGIYQELISFDPWLFYPPAFLRCLWLDFVASILGWILPELQSSLLSVQSADLLRSIWREG